MCDGTKTSVEGQYLSDFSTSKKDKKWDIHRSSTQNVEAIFREGDEFHQRQAKRMSQCAGRLLFLWGEPDEKGETKLKLKQAKFCKVPSCAVCQWRRSLVWQARMFISMKPILIQFPTHRWLFLTLTVKNCPVTELKVNVKAMQSAFTRLRKRKEWRSVHGYIKSLEITRSENGEAHPHFHVSMLVPSSYFSGKNYIKQQKWREIWGDCLRVDYLPVVNIKPVKSKNPDNPHDISAAIVEILKYQMKVAELEQYPDFLKELAKQIFRVRAIELGGFLKDCLKQEEPTDEELVGKSDEERLDDLQKALTFGWNRSEKRYKKS